MATRNQQRTDSSISQTGVRRPETPSGLESEAEIKSTREQEALAKLVANQTNSKITHMSYHCPGLNGVGTRMDIAPWKFAQLFHPIQPKIVIPLFQRRYCWKKQIAGWFRDAARHISGRHLVGKIVLKRSSVMVEGEEVLVCVDGQQRITTSLILTAAIRDCALALTRGPQGPTVAPHVQPLINMLNSVLYRDVEAFHAWCVESGTGGRRQAGGGDEPHQKEGKEEGKEGENGWDECDSALPMGTTLPFSTLLPSFVDRAAFFECITAGPLAHLRAQRRRSSSVAVTGSSGVGASRYGDSVPLSKHARQSLQGQAKGTFDRLVWEYAAAAAANGGGSGGAAEEEEEEAAAAVRASLRAAQSLCALAQGALHGMCPMRSEILSPVNFAQVFLWLQERSLFSPGSLLTDPAPGEAFRGCDMIRNLFLAGAMGRSMREQEERYQRLWLRPLELRFGNGGGGAAAAGGRGGGGEGSGAALDAVLAAFLSHVDRCRAQAPHKPARTVGSCEKAYAKMSGTACAAARKGSGALLYARFHSLVQERTQEALLARAAQRQRQGGAEPAAAGGGLMPVPLQTAPSPSAATTVAMLPPRGQGGAAAPGDATAADAAEVAAVAALLAEVVEFASTHAVPS